MRVLALYDVHGNPDALDAVLADPRAEAPDAVVVGGDAVPGPFARETVDRLRDLTVPVHWVRGNGEREVGEALSAPPAPVEDVVAHLAQRSAAALGEDDAAWLAARPLEVTVDGVLYCHATPRGDEEILTRISPLARWAQAFAGVTAAVAVVGHTHQQDDRTVGDLRVVNAGSVGLPYEGDGAARWAWVADGVPVLRSTPYDAAAAGTRMLATGWPDERSVRAALLEPVAAMEITRLFEQRAQTG